jgi:hypothetical protein
VARSGREDGRRSGTSSGKGAEADGGRSDGSSCDLGETLCEHGVLLLSVVSGGSRPDNRVRQGPYYRSQVLGTWPSCVTSFLAVACQGDGTAGLANPGRGDPAKEWSAGLHAIHARRPIPTCPIRLAIPRLANDGLPLRRENGRHRLSRGGCRFRERAVLFGSRLAIAAADERGACAGFGAGSRSDPDIVEGDLLPAG